MIKRSEMEVGIKYMDEDKVVLIPVKDISEPTKILPKPPWMKIKLKADNQKVKEIKSALRKNKLHSVCEEASCPNLAECFNHGTATFMILGDICTRRCSFCDVSHGKPLAVDIDEPLKLAQTIKDMKLKYVVITSVDRDDLEDRGATHYANCIKEIRKLCPDLQIETLVPDFRGKIPLALEILNEHTPDVFNHNLETIESIYSKVKPGGTYKLSLELLRRFKEEHPEIPTKSGIILGIGESKEEVITALKDLRANNVTMLTLGQYLAPSPHHLAVARYVEPSEFIELKEIALEMGFTHVASGPFVRSSYHADLQALGVEVK